MGGAASGLALCLLAAVLLRWDLLGFARRWRWRRATGRIAFLPTAAGPSWRIDFALPDGTPIGVVTTDLRLVARRGEGAVPLLYDPAQPARIDLPVRPGLATLVGAGLLGLGIVQLLR